MTNGIWKIVTALVCVAVLALGIVLGIMPRLADAGAANENRLAAEATNLQHEATLSFLKQENERIDEISAELKELRKALPEGPEYTKLVTQLGVLAESNGVLLTETTIAGTGALVDSTSLGTPADSSKVVVGIPVSISVLGAYADVVRFIGALQSGERIFQLSTVIVDSSEDAGVEAGSYSTVITGLIFAYTDAAVAPTDPNAAPADPNAVPAEEEQPAP